MIQGSQTDKVLPIEDLSHAGEARRIASALAQRQGMNEGDTGRVAIVVTELARNIVLHAGRGQILARRMEGEGRAGVEILALDKGPGMADIERCLQDGYSTAGTPGTGLGAVARLSDFLDIYSLPGQGTAMLSRILSAGAAHRPPSGENGLIVGVVSAPLRGEEVCGDGWAVRDETEPWQLLVADGLGHGPIAAEAAREMLGVFVAGRARKPAQILEQAHGVLRATRGAAVAIAELDPAARQVRFTGVGNIAGSVFIPGQKSVNMVSHNGTIGLEARKIHEFAYNWPPGALLIMHSDGLSTHWNLEPYPGLASRHPGLIAGVLYRDFRRERDDATVVVAREIRQGNEPGYTQH